LPARKNTFVGKLPVHSVTAAISIAAQAQQFPGAQEIVTERPLKLRSGSHTVHLNFSRIRSRNNKTEINT
jgi:hypothetical protein